MKKILFVMGLLAVSGLAFADVTQGSAIGSKPYVEGDVTVKAKVVESLTMDATSTIVDFGTLLQGQENKPAVSGGDLTISGEKNTNIIITVKSPDDEFVTMDKVGKNGLSVALKKDGTGEGKLSTNLKFIHGNVAISEKVVALDEKGKYEIIINGTATTTSDQEFGNYFETVKVKAQYE